MSKIAIQIQCLHGKKILDPDHYLDRDLDNFAPCKHSIRLMFVIRVVHCCFLTLVLVPPGRAGDTCSRAPRTPRPDTATAPPAGSPSVS